MRTASQMCVRLVAVIVIVAGCTGSAPSPSAPPSASSGASVSSPTTAASAGSSSQAAATKINFVLDWTPNPFQNFVYAAQENGYYTGHGDIVDDNNDGFTALNQ
jgi:ABC-type nitrate/sulfonate/bicarbonate transport system substrate-binding protein